ncbi:hypothetical protein L2X99_13240 [Microbacterium sp. KUDC0406]|uniref:hypothetical protein n=1 Tax=Microbacterium sp. KUDC0406 TaxID=2909588 RepID=UPI001F3009B5|nr:hypothetical protein [Microbacterium sp. KUDC0406]UJP09386.1 hypothetical protein L2X99_13240 [Microbacterium sp. KUDC0406]
MSTAQPLGTSLFRRSSAWFILVGTGNLAILFLVLATWLSPLGIPVPDSVTFLHAFVGPMYTPTLLFFTSALSLLAALNKSGRSEDGDDDANRLIARAVQFALTIVLSFAIVMVAAEPISIAQVLFALLLGFVTYVLAERIAPPVVPSAEATFRKAQSNHARRVALANASLGSDWRHNLMRRVWPMVTLFAIAPVALLTVLGVLISSVMWSAELALSATSISLFATSSYGAAILAVAWLATADKTESPSSRAWRGGTFIVMGLFTSGALATVFFFAGESAQVLGWLIIVVTALQAAALWVPVPWVGAKVLKRVSVTITDRSLTKVEKALADARSEWVADLIAEREAEGFWRRLGRRFGWEA